jgi:hypothetical protein
MSMKVIFGSGAGSKQCAIRLAIKLWQKLQNVKQQKLAFSNKLT